MTRQYRLTRDLPASARGNYFPRDLKAGDILYLCTNPYAAGCAGRGGIMLTESSDDSPTGYEVPLGAVQETAPAGPYT
jgi:hypothetical protein